MKITPQTLRSLITSSLGGGLEIYDFTIYVFFAPIISQLFFPASHGLVALIKTFAVFLVGYLSRPLGALIFGHYGDKFGRKKGMLCSIALMAFSTASIGFLPTFTSIGILAPILLILLRFLQGIAIGGDLPGAITFVTEYAEPNNRGLFNSILFCAVNLGVVLASSIGALLTLILSQDQLTHWGWRVGFISGIGIGILGFYLRVKVAETPCFSELEKSHQVLKTPLHSLFKMQKGNILRGIGLVWFFAIVIAQVFLYMPTYLYTAAHIKLSTGLLLNSCNILLFSLLIPVAGHLSDKVGRKIVVTVTAILFIVLTFPFYTLLVQTNFLLLVIGLMGFAILSAGVIGVVPCMLGELFPTPVRYSGVAISYNIGHAIFAGLTPMIATFLLYQLSFPQAPSLNLILSACVSLCTLATMKEKRINLTVKSIPPRPSFPHAPK